ncbi:unnamed protein product [Notodromas monacha]|uniref:Uncharacterized protein n=1 Tax=Notodromas monacha TaxID=399045 RepID=A0A7R9GAS6_9CRUS|nr:unnamed protein product [Notodromas monacha]CAG0915764.1 unnamed protein product [Notodromas monacha]
MGSTRLRTVYCTLWAAMFVTARSFAADKEHGIDRDLSDMTDIVYNKDSDNEPHYVQYDVASIPVKMTGVERFLSTFITSNGRRYPLRYATDHSGVESRPKVFNSPLLQKSAATHQKPSIGRAKMKPRTKPAKILQKAKTLKLKKTTGHYDKERHIGIPIRQKGKTRPKHNPATKENPAKQGGKLSNSDKKVPTCLKYVSTLESPGIKSATKFLVSSVMGNSEVSVVLDVTPSPKSKMYSVSLTILDPCILDLVFVQTFICGSMRYFNFGHPLLMNGNLSHFLDTHKHNPPDILAIFAFISKVPNEMLVDLGLRVEYIKNEEVVDAHLMFVERLFDLVLIMERMEESLVLMRHQLGWDLEDVLAFHHNSAMNQGTETLSKTQLQDLDNLLSDDHKLYSKFEAILEAKIQEFGHQRMADEVAALKCLQEQAAEMCQVQELPPAKLPLPYRPYSLLSSGLYPKVIDDTWAHEQLKQFCKRMCFTEAVGNLLKMLVLEELVECPVRPTVEVQVQKNIFWYPWLFIRDLFIVGKHQCFLKVKGQQVSEKYQGLLVGLMQKHQIKGPVEVFYVQPEPPKDWFSKRYDTFNSPKDQDMGFQDRSGHTPTFTPYFNQYHKKPYQKFSPYSSFDWKQQSNHYHTYTNPKTSTSTTTTSTPSPLRLQKYPVKQPWHNSPNGDWGTESITEPTKPQVTQEVPTESLSGGPLDDPEFLAFLAEELQTNVGEVAEALRRPVPDGYSDQQAEFLKKLYQDFINKKPVTTVLPAEQQLDETPFDPSITHGLMADTPESPLANFRRQFSHVPSGDIGKLLELCGCPSKQSKICAADGWNYENTCILRCLTASRWQHMRECHIYKTTVTGRIFDVDINRPYALQENFGGERVCRVSIAAMEGMCGVQFKKIQFDLGQRIDSCNKNYLLVEEAKFCNEGNYFPGLVNFNPEMRVDLSYHLENDTKGFDLFFSQVPCEDPGEDQSQIQNNYRKDGPCEIYLSGATGRFMTSALKSHQLNTKCRVTIVADDSKCGLELKFHRFSLSRNRQCEEEYFKVSGKRYCGSGPQLMPSDLLRMRGVHQAIVIVVLATLGHGQPQNFNAQALTMLSQMALKPCPQDTSPCVCRPTPDGPELECTAVNEAQALQFSQAFQDPIHYRKITLQRSRMLELPHDAFGEATADIYVIQNNPNLETIEIGALGNFANPKILIVQRNPQLEEFPFSDLKKWLDLEKFVLTDNRILEIPDFAFDGVNGQLKEIHLQRNVILDLGPLAFRGLSNLEYLDLSGNQIAALSAGSLFFSEPLKHLDLSRNRISNIDVKAFEDPSRSGSGNFAEYIDFSNNLFTFLENAKWEPIFKKLDSFKASLEEPPSTTTQFNPFLLLQQFGNLQQLAVSTTTQAPSTTIVLPVQPTAVENNPEALFFQFLQTLLQKNGEGVPAVQGNPVITSGAPSTTSTSTTTTTTTTTSTTTTTEAPSTSTTTTEPPTSSTTAPSSSTTALPAVTIPAQVPDTRVSNIWSSILSELDQLIQAKRVEITPIGSTTTTTATSSSATESPSSVSSSTNGPALVELATESGINIQPDTIPQEQNTIDVSGPAQLEFGARVPKAFHSEPQGNQLQQPGAGSVKDPEPLGISSLEPQELSLD